jgi:hypothetical protein
MPRASFERRASAKATQGSPRLRGTELAFFRVERLRLFRLLSRARRDLAWDDLNLGGNGPYGRLRRRSVAGRGDNKGRLSGAFVRADDGTRTHDLLHGKRVVDSGQRAPETARLSRIASFCARCMLRAIPAICGRFSWVWALERLLCPMSLSRIGPSEPGSFAPARRNLLSPARTQQDSHRNGRVIRKSKPISPSQWIAAWNLTSDVVPSLEHLDSKRARLGTQGTTGMIEPFPARGEGRVSPVLSRLYSP